MGVRAEKSIHAVRTLEDTVSAAVCQAPNSMAKWCPKCLHFRLRSEFYANKQTNDSLDCWCKECRKENTRKWNDDNRGYHGKRKKEWRKVNPDKNRELDTKDKAKHRKRHPDREYARQGVALAREHGLVLSSCSWPNCTATKKIEAAHDDYSKPHLIHGLCRKHHRMWDYCKGELPFDLPTIDISAYLKPSGRGRPRRALSRRVEVSP